MLADADAAIAFSIREEDFRNAARLKWVHSPAAAVHQLMFPALVKSDVVVTNSRNVHGPVVAEHALALLVALAKKLPFAVRAQTEKRWVQTETWELKPTVQEIRGATAVVVGFGSIGREFAKRANALGMHVIAVREHPERGGEDVDQVSGQENLKQVLPRADFVVLAAPLTESTKGIICADALALMPSHSYLINVSRGPLIDDDALVAALKARKIAGAALDVFVEEPLPPSSPYWELDNVLVTSHTAAITKNLWERQYGLISVNMRRFKQGEELLGKVSKERGY